MHLHEDKDFGPRAFDVKHYSFHQFWHMLLFSLIIHAQAWAHNCDNSCVVRVMRAELFRRNRWHQSRRQNPQNQWLCVRHTRRTAWECTIPPTIWGHWCSDWASTAPFHCKVCLVCVVNVQRCFCCIFVRCWRHIPQICTTSSSKLTKATQKHIMYITWYACFRSCLMEPCFA